MRTPSAALPTLVALALHCSPAAAQHADWMCPTRADLRSTVSVEEASVTLDVALAPDRARIDTRVEFRSESADTGELSYGLNMGGDVVGLEVCIADRCREAEPDGGPSALSAYRLALVAPRTDTGPVTPVAQVTFQRQFGVHLYAAPISAAHPIDATIRSWMETELHGGRVIAHVPVTGVGAQTRVRVTAPGLERVTIDGEATREVVRRPGATVRIEADLPAGPPTVVSERVACEGHTCSRVWIGSPAAARRRDMIVVLDASASMNGVAPGGVRRALEGLRGAMSPGSTVRVIAFGRTVATPLPEASPAARLEPAALAGLDLGNVSRAALVWPTVQRWAAESRDAFVVVVTDGLTRLAPPAGLEVSTVELRTPRFGEPWPSPFAELVRARGGVAIDLAPALARDPNELMAPRLRRLFAPAISPRVRLRGEPAESALRAGEARRARVRGARVGSAEGLRLTPTEPPAAEAALLSRWLGRTSPAFIPRSLIAVAPGAVAAARAWLQPGSRRYPDVPGAAPTEHLMQSVGWPGPCTGSSARDRHPRCGASSPRTPTLHCSCWGATVGGSLSREMIRRTMNSARPAVNACFARARAGRPDWEASFTYQLVVDHREVLSARVTRRSPTVDDALVECLLDRPIANLRVPGAVGDSTAVAINYPFGTIIALPPATVELDPELDDALDSLVGEEPADGADL